MFPEGTAKDSVDCFCCARCVLAGGLSPPEFTDLRTVLEEEDRERVQGDDSIATPLILTTPDLAGKTLGDVLGDAASISTSQVSVARSFIVLVVLYCFPILSPTRDGHVFAITLACRPRASIFSPTPTWAMNLCLSHFLFGLIRDRESRRKRKGRTPCR